MFDFQIKQIDQENLVEKSNNYFVLPDSNLLDGGLKINICDDFLSVYQWLHDYYHQKWQADSEVWMEFIFGPQSLWG